MPHQGCREVIQSKRRAFTLTELLIVVATMLVLMLLLFPAVKSAMSSARRTACMSNLQLIAQQVEAYRQDNVAFPEMPGDVGRGGIPTGGITGLALGTAGFPESTFWCEADQYPQLAMGADPNMDYDGDGVKLKLDRRDDERAYLRINGLRRDYTASTYQYGYNYYGYVTTTEGLPFPITTPEAAAFFYDGQTDWRLQLVTSARGNTSGNAGNPGLTDLFFLHHSVGDGLVVGGKMREAIEEYNASQVLQFELWDHGYNADGMRNPGGQTVAGYNIPNNDSYDGTSPEGLYNLWTSADPAYVASRDQILTHQVIAFKSCYPASNIPDATTLQQYKDWYLAMRDVFDTHPDKRFVVMSPPPLHRLETNAVAASNARAFADWLSGPYVNGHPNVVCFDLFNHLAAADDGSPTANMLRYQYETSHTATDSHPNTLANETVGPILAAFLCGGGAVVGYRPSSLFPGLWNTRAPADTIISFCPRHSAGRTGVLPVVTLSGTARFIKPILPRENNGNSPSMSRTFDRHPSVNARQVPIDWRIHKAPFTTGGGRDDHLFGDALGEANASAMPLVEVQYRRFGLAEFTADGPWYDTGITVKPGDAVMTIANAKWTWMNFNLPAGGLAKLNTPPYSNYLGEYHNICEYVRGSAAVTMFTNGNPVQHILWFTADGDPIERKHANELLIDYSNPSNPVPKAMQLPMHPHNLLLGRIGATGTIFPLGSRGFHISDADGNLFLTTNDLRNSPNDSSYTDNLGWCEVWIGLYGP